MPIITPIKCSPLSVLPPSGGGSDIQTWYDSLSVKPSAGLWTDIQNLYNGMVSDGDWAEADFISLTAGLETDEQRLRPLKTTSGDDMILIDNGGGLPSLNINGVLGNDSSCINTKWNPFDDGVKYSLNNSYIGIYSSSQTNTRNQEFIFGSILYLDPINDISTNIETSRSSTIIRNLSRPLNSTYTTSFNMTKAKVSFPIPFFLGNKRIDNLQCYAYLNSSVSGVLNKASNFLINYDFAMLGVNELNTFFSTCLDYQRFGIAGSSLIDHNRVAARLNTFFTARGLSIANY